MNYRGQHRRPTVVTQLEIHERACWTCGVDVCTDIDLMIATYAPSTSSHLRTASPLASQLELDLVCR
jgi:hypothetical protein